MENDAHTTAMDGTPIVLIFGQSNAATLYYSGALQDTLEAMNSDAEVVMVARGATAVAHPDGAWNIITGDGEDTPGELAVELLQTVDDLEGTDQYIAGAIWIQGESDRSVSEDYYDATKALFDSFQDALDAPVPITIFGLSDMQDGSDGAGHQGVVAAQQQLADDHAEIYFLDIDKIGPTAG